MYTEYRADGWPLCPHCGEDELYSLFAWDGSDPKPPMSAWVDHGLKCYRCGFDSDHRTLHVTMATERAMTPLTPHCDERQAIMRAVCDALSLVNVTAPINTPPIPPARFVKFGDAMICTVCQLDARYCRGHAPAAQQAKDGAESSLERRVRECMGGK